MKEGNIPRVLGTVLGLEKAVCSAVSAFTAVTINYSSGRSGGSFIDTCKAKNEPHERSRQGAQSAYRNARVRGVQVYFVVQWGQFFTYFQYFTYFP